MSFSKYSKMEQYAHYLFLEQYAEHLFLNTVNYLELKGSFKMFFPNLFTWFLIKDSLAYLAEDILNPFGFCVPETWYLSWDTFVSYDTLRERTNSLQKGIKSVPKVERQRSVK